MMNFTSGAFQVTVIVRDIAQRETILEIPLIGDDPKTLGEHWPKVLRDVVAAIGLESGPEVASSGGAVITEHRKDLERFRDELIQTAAVCAAIAEDLEFGIAEFDRKLGRDPFGEPLNQGEVIINRIRHERRRQDDKWGPQHQNPMEWMAILAEEFGESAEELLGGRLEDFTDRDDPVEKAFLYAVVVRSAEAGKFAQNVLDTYIFPKED